MIKFDSAMIRTLAAEFLCTFIFIFVICANALNDMRSSSVGSLSGGVSTAFVAIAIIYTFGKLSGAHFNPAVTVGAMIGGMMSPVQGVLYMILQLLAALLAVSALMALFPDPDVASKLVLNVGVGANSAQAIFFEFIMAFILVYVIYATALGVKTTVDDSDVESQDEQSELIAQNKMGLHFAPIAIGLTLGFLCFLGGTVSGGAFNPARATAPAILSGSWTNIQNLWIYWVGDFTGAMAAAAVYKYVFAR